MEWFVWLTVFALFWAAVIALVMYIVRTIRSGRKAPPANTTE